MDVKVIKLVSGEEVIAELVNSSENAFNHLEDTFEFKNPLVIGVTERGIATMPLSVVADIKQVTLKKQHIIFIASPEEEILNAYKGQFGGILTPRSLELP